MPGIITKQFLNDIGIVIDNDEYQSLERHFDETLHARVIAEIVDELSPEQAEELARMRDADDETLQQWFVANIPDLEDVVSDEVDILLGEIAEDSEKIKI